MAAKQGSSSSAAFKQPDLLGKLVSGNTEFAVDMYKELCKRSDGNVFFSPISISVALAMTYLGAKVNTAFEMKNGLKLAPLTDEDIHSVYQEMCAFLQTDKSSSFILNTANRIFARKDYVFKAEFLEATSKYYKAEAQTLDFASDSEGSSKIINKWVEAQTANKIQDLIPSGSLNAQTAMVLVNAIYFKGSWKDKFEKSATQPGKFKLGGGQEVDADMMFTSEKMMYGEDRNLGCKIVELPYVNDDLSMFIILPNKEDGLSELMGKVDHAKLLELTTQMGKIDVELTLPKFKLEDKFSLNDVLQSLGMKDMFIGGIADFSGMDGTKELYVSSVVHQSFIDVNEEGSEAAAATGVIMMCMSMPITMRFEADHPFLFFIRDNHTKGILFMGHLANPK